MLSRWRDHFQKVMNGNEEGRTKRLVKCRGRSGHTGTLTLKDLSKTINWEQQGNQH